MKDKKQKIVVLYDSVINIKEVKRKREETISEHIKKNNYLLSIGRFTKQKNFDLLIDAFCEFNKITIVY